MGEKKGKSRINRSILWLVSECICISLTVVVGADDFYDETVLYTLELEFAQSDWWDQLTANYNAKENIAATLIVDGMVYEDVGVRFHSNTSYQMTGNSQKKSFNIEVDETHGDQRLMGYKTLNLINCLSDPTFMREVLYSNTARQQIPSGKANFVKLLINGENWGIHANVQQLNAEFIEDWFPSNDGTRWRAEGIPVSQRNPPIHRQYDPSEYWNLARAAADPAMEVVAGSPAVWPL